MWKFEPILKPTIWGGSRIASFKGIEDTGRKIGESWELSGVEGSESVVSEGPEAGLKLPDLLVKYGSAILGERNFTKFGTKFPMLVKYIDANSDLSVQVHPHDAMAERLSAGNGKTEMWYVLDGGKKGRLAAGFREPINPDDFDKLIDSEEIESHLKYHKAKSGDVYYIPAGRVHTICAGTFLVEIQQTSDVTYRIYDYHRKDEEGKERELHPALAKEAINFEDVGVEPVRYNARRDIPINVVKCPHFTTNLMVLDEEVMRDYAELDSFVVLIVTDGKGHLYCGADAVSNEPTEMRVKQGDTILVSASAKGLTIIPEGGGLELLETYVG